MKKKLTTVAFNGTKEQEAKLDAVIAEHKGEQGALMPVLQKAQDIYGYLTISISSISHPAPPNLSTMKRT